MRRTYTEKKFAPIALFNVLLYSRYTSFGHSQICLYVHVQNRKKGICFSEVRTVPGGQKLCKKLVLTTGFFKQKVVVQY